MRSKLLLLVAVLTLGPLVVSPARGEDQRSASPTLVLTARKAEDKTREIPGSSWYIAELLNNSNVPQTLEVIQMPGGYAGSGKFFACGLQAWSARRHAWVVLRSAKQSEYGHNPIEKVEIKPAERMQVCARLLPAQAGSVGQCVRFTLRMRWNEDSSGSLVSEPFSVDARVATSGSPCSVH
jgi:hypothetical protein